MIKYLKQLPKALAISFSIFLLLVIIELLMGKALGFNQHLFVRFLYTMFYGISLFFANGIVFDYVESFYKSNQYTPRRLIISFLASFLVSIFVVFLLRIFEDVLVEGQTFSVFFKNESAANYVVAIIITFIVTLAIHAFHFYKAYNENKVKEQKIIAGTANAKFESLKNQIDPHFLFNSLNLSLCVGTKGQGFGYGSGRIIICQNLHELAEDAI